MGDLPENRLIRVQEGSITAAEIEGKAGLGRRVVPLSVHLTREDATRAFTEWERRWREEPDRFQEDSERLAGTSGEYGEGAAAYFFEILGETKK